RDYAAGRESDVRYELVHRKPEFYPHERRRLPPRPGLSTLRALVPRRKVEVARSGDAPLQAGPDQLGGWRLGARADTRPRNHYLLNLRRFLQGVGDICDNHVLRIDDINGFTGGGKLLGSYDVCHYRFHSDQRAVRELV